MFGRAALSFNKFLKRNIHWNEWVPQKINFSTGLTTELPSFLNALAVVGRSGAAS